MASQLAWVKTSAQTSLLTITGKAGDSILGAGGTRVKLVAKKERITYNEERSSGGQRREREFFSQSARASAWSTIRSSASVRAAMLPELFETL